MMLAQLRLKVSVKLFFFLPAARGGSSPIHMSQQLGDVCLAIAVLGRKLDIARLVGIGRCVKVRAANVNK